VVTEREGRAEVKEKVALFSSGLEKALEAERGISERERGWQGGETLLSI